MDIPINEPLVPENIMGKALDLHESIAEIDSEAAIITYNRACSRLLNPRIWKEVSGTFSAGYALMNEQNEDPKRLLKVGDFIRIDIPGPGTHAGEGFDWVTVETLLENTEPQSDDSFGMRLRSCGSPINNKGETAHFFHADATSSFLLKRKNNIITISYYGRNEVPNTKNVDIIDKVRNTVVAAWAMMGISKLQWSFFIKGLLQKEIGG